MESETSRDVSNGFGSCIGSISIFFQIQSDTETETESHPSGGEKNRKLGQGSKTKQKSCGRVATTAEKKTSRLGRR